LKFSKEPIMTKTSVLVHDDQVRLLVRQARDRQTETVRLAKASNPPPGGYARPAGEQEWQGTSNTRGGRGTDKAPFGQDQGGDRCMAAIRQVLAQPFKEAGGLITMLGSRAA
jgi:hypothetical protein